MWILKRLCSEEQLEILYGDSLEIFYKRVGKVGPLKAKVLFVRDTFSMLKSFAMKKPTSGSKFGSLSLVGNYFKMSLRSMAKNKLSSGINFFGLSAGLFAALLIGQYVNSQLNYDRFHKDYDDIYRLSFTRKVNNDIVFNGATTFYPVGPQLNTDYPEVASQCRLYYPFTHGVINIGENAYTEEKPVFVDDVYFTFFSYNLLVGDKNTVLENPNAVVLSEALAEKYFGTEDPIDKVIRFSFEDGATDLRVTGVMNNPRPDSHLRLNMLISMRTLDQWPVFEQSSWQLPFYHTYIKVVEGAEIEAVEKSADAVLLANRPQGQENGNAEYFKLQPLKDIHLDSDLTFEMNENGDREAVNFLAGVAILILLIAYLNYINLATALSIKGAKEVGLRKVMGSPKFDIVIRFVFEALLFNAICLLLAIGVVALTVGYFSNLLGTFFGLSNNPLFWILIVSLVAVGALISSIYPALILSGFRPISVLRGKFASSKKGSLLRKVLISSQFIISVAMIGGTILLNQQTNYLLSKDLGFDGDKVLVINAPRVTDPNRSYLTAIRSFGNELITSASVNAYTHSGSVPGKVMSAGTVARMGINNPEPVSMHLNTTDYGFFETYGLQILAGRGFSDAIMSDDSAVVINEAAMEALGFTTAEDALNGKIGSRGFQFNIIGVVSNYHHTSLKTTYEPIAFLLRPQRTIYLSLNVNTSQMPQTLEEIKGQMKEHFPDSPFDYFFLDQTFNQEFQAELRYAAVFKGFSILAIVLAAMGLFGLSTFLLTQRKKEIGVRKVLGAEGSHLFALLSSSFFIPITIGSVMACLLLYAGGSRWLESFPFRVSLQWIVFVMPILIVAAMVGLTMAIQTINAMRIQPASTLRNE